MENNCIACGMPMKEKSDFAKGDETLDYCKFCAREDGTMQNFEEKLASMTAFIMKTQAVDEIKARETAIMQLVELPAWKGLVGN